MSEGLHVPGINREYHTPQNAPMFSKYLADRRVLYRQGDFLIVDEVNVATKQVVPPTCIRISDIKVVNAVIEHDDKLGHVCIGTAIWTMPNVNSIVPYTALEILAIIEPK